MKKSKRLFYILLFFSLTIISCTPDKSTIKDKIKAIAGNDGKPKKVADIIIKKIKSLRLRNSKFGISKIAWTDTIFERGAAFIAPHFKSVKLGKEDFLIIKSLDGKRKWKYAGDDIRLKLKNGFWGIPVEGDKLIVQLEQHSDAKNISFEIDKISKGLGKEHQKDGTEAICRKDDSKNAKCLETTHPRLYHKSRPVVRLLSYGQYTCTGWLVGDEGHLMTNNHCIKTATDAMNTTYEFMAEGSNCLTDCQSWYACPGTIEATSGTIVQTDYDLDYTLIKLSDSLAEKYGYLQMRKSGAIQNEAIYIPQHPAGWGKRIANETDDRDGNTRQAIISSLKEPRCRVGKTENDIGYMADTRGGSSGSPVIALKDDAVVALHHCANCPNRGIPIEEIIEDLGDNLPNNALFIEINTDTLQKLADLLWSILRKKPIDPACLVDGCPDPWNNINDRIYPLFIRAKNLYADLPESERKNAKLRLFEKYRILPDGRIKFEESILDEVSKIENQPFDQLDWKDLAERGINQIAKIRTK